MSMKTVTVKQVAEALNLTTRAVRDRLTRGDLKGTQKVNSFGVKEWRVYPTKEIAAKLNLDLESDVQNNDFPAMEETVDAELMGEEGTEPTPHQAWVAEERQNMRIVAEEMMKPLLATIREQERQLEDQGRQLKLLPDFQKQAEADRQMAIEKAMEAEALAKQVAALKILSDEAKAAKNKAAELEQALEEQRTRLIVLPKIICRKTTPYAPA
jgi:hypothetical protein